MDQFDVLQEYASSQRNRLRILFKWISWTAHGISDRDVSESAKGISEHPMISPKVVAGGRTLVARSQTFLEFNFVCSGTAMVWQVLYSQPQLFHRTPKSQPVGASEIGVLTEGSEGHRFFTNAADQ